MAAHEQTGGTRRNRSNGSSHDRTAVFGDWEAAWSDVRRLVRERMTRQPYGTAAGGFAAGFVLGGGLTPRIAATLFGTAGRAVFASAAAQMIHTLSGTRRRNE